MSRANAIGHQKSINFDNEAMMGAFGLNLDMILTLLDHDYQWLSTRTDMQMPLLMNIKIGKGGLNEERAEAIRSVLEVKIEDLMTNHDNEEVRKERLQKALIRYDLLEEDGTLARKPVNNTVSLVPSVGDPPSNNFPSDDGVDESPPLSNDTDEGLHLKDPVWADDDRAVTLGARLFDLNDKEVRRVAMLSLQAANPHTSVRVLLEEASLDKVSSWFGGVRKGVSRILRPDLEALVGACGEGVTLGIILTGYGLRLSDVTSKASAKASPSYFTASMVPKVSRAKVQSFMRDKLLSGDVEVTDSKKLMDVIRKQDEGKADEIDWVEMFFQSTEKGVAAMQNIDTVISVIKEGADEFRVLFLSMIVAGVWPENDEAGD